MGMANVYRGPCKVTIKRMAKGGQWICLCNGCGDQCTFSYWPEAIIRAQKHAHHSDRYRLASW